MICATCGRSLGHPGFEGLCEVCLLTFGWMGFPDPANPGDPSDAPPSGRPGFWRRVGDYELGPEIARGGMGVVYRAREVGLDREVAVKMILAGHWASPEQVERFRVEARASARLEHPNIVPILAFGEHEGWHFYAMKLVEGGDLARQLADGRWPASTRPEQERIAQFLAQVAGAAHFAHQRGILHRDLKPTNSDGNGSMPALPPPRNASDPGFAPTPSPPL
ncbi:MAG: serine/threonine protein kinase [Verrucomicrobiae bacterium]|nr:serine/threonine protein kinase [Verrucomicrobiae bacterium]